MNKTARMLRRWVALAVLAGTLIGCVTAQQAQQKQAVEEAKACFAALEEAPELTILGGKAPEEPTLEQMPDPSFMTEEETTALTSFYPKINLCQKNMIAILQQISPTAAFMYATDFRNQ